MTAEARPKSDLEQWMARVTEEEIDWALAKYPEGCARSRILVRINIAIGKRSGAFKAW